MIQVQQVTYAYETGKTISFPDFSVNDSEPCLLLGQSGSGKTTLLHLIGGLLKNQAGKIRIRGTDLSTLSESALDKFRGKHIGFIFQKNHLITALSVKNNLRMAPYLGGLKQDDARIEEVLNEVSLLDKSAARVTSLSHGQAQRVAIARAVLNKPDIILADEPTSALDDKNCERVIEMLLTVAKQNGSALLIATHDQRLTSKISRQIIL
ncbi:MAG TPA: ATP-binding cassette domain-containing protein [Chryseosolibacter sp.]